MTCFLQMREPYVFRKYGHIALALLWTLGFAFGISLFWGSSSFPMMQVISVSRLSIVELIFTSLLPFAFLAFAVYISQPLLLYLYSFIRAALFSFIYCSVSSLFGEAGWLFGILLCFHSILLMPFTCWYTIHNVGYKRRFCWKRFSFVSAVCVITSLIEYFYIIPLLRNILDYRKG